MEEKKTNQGAGMPAFDVWAYDVLGESDLRQRPAVVRC